MHTDPIADFLNTIKMAFKAKKEFITAPSSNIKFAIAKILRGKNILTDLRKEKKDGKENIAMKINLEQPAINVRKISKPGQRIYKNNQSVKRVKNGFGIGIYTTSKGILTDSEVKKLKIGGELICEIF